MRRSYEYEYECKHIDHNIVGRYSAEYGYLETVYLPDGTGVEINLDGKPRDDGQGAEALALASLIAKHILRDVHHQNEIDQTRREESWAGHAPVVL